MDLFDLVHGGVGDDGGAEGVAPRKAYPSPEELLADLNPEQRRAVLHEKGPLLILAGAGSGKTRAITHRIAYLVRGRNVPPSGILAITFTNKAANEMKSRVDDLVGPISSYMWVGTFHAMMMRVLRRHIELLGFERGFTVLDSDDQHRSVRACILDLTIDEKVFQPRAVHAAISRAKNELQSVEEYASLAGADFRLQKIAEVYRLYQERLRRNNSLDFDDILTYSVELFERFPDVLATYQNRFLHVMVDEYQDTNRAQYLLVRMLAAKHGNLCVVGDDDQSIYAFRGATVRNILDFEKDFPKCAVIKLEQNYRSTKMILDVANHVISNNQGRKDKKLWTESLAGEKVSFLAPTDQHAEADYITEEIKRLVDATTDTTRHYRDFAILYRLNALSRNLEEALNRRGIPYRIYGGVRFYERREVKDCVAYLHLIANRLSDIAFERVVNVPKRGIGDATLEAVAKVALERGVGRMDACGLAAVEPSLARMSARLMHFHELIQDFRARLGENAMRLAEFVEYVQNESGQLQELIDQKNQQKSLEETDRVENLKELISVAVDYEKALDAERASLAQGLPEGVHPDDREAPPSDLSGILNGFLEQVALYSDTDAMDDTKDFVRLMTIHSAKGLEFRTVFLVGAEEGLFPGFRSMDNEADIEEERRLMYVAITRARESLYISAAKTRLVFGQTRSYMPSRFVKEIPEDLLLLVDTAVRTRSFLMEKTANAARARAERPGRPPELTGTGSAFQVPVIRTFTPPRFGKTPAGMAAGAGSVAGVLGADDIAKGDRVVHARFGSGKVSDKEPVAGDAILVIEFDDVGAKRLMAKQANLVRET
jgi:DNA helicase-2/ATP-dependent DNA helicase PcrA